VISILASLFLEHTVFLYWLEIASSRPLLMRFVAYFLQMTSANTLIPKCHILVQKHVV